jgi:hypothetical protein
MLTYKDNKDRKKETNDKVLRNQQRSLLEKARNRSLMGTRGPDLEISTGTGDFGNKNRRGMVQRVESNHGNVRVGSKTVERNSVWDFEQNGAKANSRSLN